MPLHCVTLMLHHPRPPESTITLDNKAVVDYGPENPHREASDIDLREMAARDIQRKSIMVRWIPGHCQLSDARNAQQCTDIIRNNEVNRLAKLATTLTPRRSTPRPSPPASPQEALKRPTRPRSGSQHCPNTRPIPGFIGSHGYLCGHAAATCGSRGFGATSATKGGPPPPWEKTKIHCELCHDTHRGTPHARSVHCAAWRPVFLQEWVRMWGPLADITQPWLTTASPNDMNHISTLHIPQSLMHSVPSQRRDSRYRVALHQYHMIHAT